MLFEDKAERKERLIATSLTKLCYYLTRLFERVDRTDWLLINAYLTAVDWAKNEELCSKGIGSQPEEETILVLFEEIFFFKSYNRAADHLTIRTYDRSDIDGLVVASEDSQILTLISTAISIVSNLNVDTLRGHTLELFETEKNPDEDRIEWHESVLTW